jgi:hypothetical protein
MMKFKSPMQETATKQKINVLFNEFQKFTYEDIRKVCDDLTRENPQDARENKIRQEVVYRMQNGYDIYQIWERIYNI